MTEPSEFLPVARREGIVTKEVDGELLVYDLVRDKAHCLNQSAAAIWQLCNGRNTVTEIAGELDPKSGALGRSSRQAVDVPTRTPDTQHPTPAFVWLALSELRRAHLLDEPEKENSNTSAKRGDWPAAMFGMSRREAVRRIGLGAIGLPLVISMTAPLAQAASSCKAGGVSCGTGAECCSGACVGGSCTGASPAKQGRVKRR